jgi:hypothetical protein
VWKATGVALKPHTWDSAVSSSQRIPSEKQAPRDDVHTGAEDYDAIFAKIPEELFNGNDSAAAPGNGTKPATCSSSQPQDLSLWDEDGSEMGNHTHQQIIGGGCLHREQELERPQARVQGAGQPQQPQQPQEVRPQQARQPGPFAASNAHSVSQAGPTRWGQFVTSRRRWHSELGAGDAPASTSSSSEEEDEHVSQKAIAAALAAKQGSSTSTQHESTGFAASELFG